VEVFTDNEEYDGGSGSANDGEDASSGSSSSSSSNEGDGSGDEGDKSGVVISSGNGGVAKPGNDGGSASGWIGVCDDPLNPGAAKTARVAPPRDPRGSQYKLVNEQLDTSGGNEFRAAAKEARARCQSWRGRVEMLWKRPLGFPP
jgi:hypothetical protein